ncbi:MAG TPA: class A beta-lactamase [Allosphingosinicella sp.]
MIDRRTFVVAASSAFALGCSRPSPEGAVGERARALNDRFGAIRATLGPGGRLGVAAIDTGSEKELRFDADSRYAMASTFKLPLAAAVLALADRGELSLSEELRFGPGDPLPNSPVVEANLKAGRLSIVRLCSAIVERSDNSAANLLLRRIGGPAALTRFFRAWGDPVTRLDRYEMELNSNLPGDPRDTTSPAAMARLTGRLVLGDVLARQSRNHLSTWLRKAVPGPDRLPAGLPEGWMAGHKTGTGANGALNDVAIAWHSIRAPIVIASYQSGGNASAQARAAAHASVAGLVMEAFA